MLSILSNTTLITSLAFGQLGGYDFDIDKYGNFHTRPIEQNWQPNYYQFDLDYGVSRETEAQEAYRLYLENQRKRILYQWEIQDLYQLRRQRNSYLIKLQRRIEAIEKSRQLNDRYQNLMGKSPN